MSNVYHCQWLPIAEYFHKGRQYIKPVWVRYKNEEGNYDMAMAFYSKDHWWEEYSRKLLSDVTDFMELPMMPMKKEWKVFSTDETQELADGEFIKREGLESFLNEIEKVGWNIHSFVNRQDTMHQFVVAYRYVLYDEEKDKKIGPVERIRMAGGEE
jgi:hypothetical protein